MSSIRALPMTQSMESTSYCHGTFNANSPSKRRPEAPPDVVCREVRGFHPVATDEHDMLVALVRSPGETLHQLLDRLEQALGPALEDQIYVDEINEP
jgi:hypothetical protein